MAIPAEEVETREWGYRRGLNLQSKACMVGGLQKRVKGSPMGSGLAGGVCTDRTLERLTGEGGWLTVRQSQRGRGPIHIKDPPEMPASPHLRMRTMPWGKAYSRLALSKPRTN